MSGFEDEFSLLSHLFMLDTIQVDNDHISWSTSIRDLPPEIVSFIFHLSTPYENGYSITLRQRFLQVCRYFRSIALSVPSLWSDIDLLCPQRIPWLLQHAGESPLAIHMDWQGSSNCYFGGWLWESDIDAVAYYGVRIQDMWTYILDHHAHQIETLEFKINQYRDPGCDIFNDWLRHSRDYMFERLVGLHLDIWLWGGRFVFMTDLFARPPPALRTLVLAGTMAADGIQYQSLTHLQTLHVGQFVLDRPTLGDVSALRALTKLELHNIGHIQPPTTQYSFSTLRKLVVTGHPEQIGYVIDGMKLPYSCIINASPSHQLCFIKCSPLWPRLDAIFPEPRQHGMSLTISYETHDRGGLWQAHIGSNNRALNIDSLEVYCPHHPDRPSTSRKIDMLIRDYEELLRAIGPVRQSLARLRIWCMTKTKPARQLNPWVEEIGFMQNVTELVMNYAPACQLFQLWIDVPQYLPSVRVLVLDSNREGPPVWTWPDDPEDLAEYDRVKMRFDVRHMLAALAARVKIGAQIMQVKVMWSTTMHVRVKEQLEAAGVAVRLGVFEDEYCTGTQ
jgi:hypothetical protein